MPNRLTRVPDRPVPTLDGCAAVVAIADAFMLVMLSRPATGSLRTAWVTPATLGLCAATVLGAAAAVAWLAAGGLSAAGVVAVAVLAAIAAGAACVLAVGVLQRRAP